MPWDAETFAGRHNHSLHGEQAAHAARIANAVLRGGAPEGEAIAIANKWAQRHAAGGGIDGYDGGGAVDATGGVGGVAPSDASANPLMQGIIQRYSSLPTEKLQELVGVMGASPQGQVIRALLQKRLTQPGNQAAGGQQQQAQAAAAPQAPQAPQPTVYQPPQQAAPQPGQQQQQPQARGGVTRREIGGGVSLSEADPYWSRQAARGETSGSGLLNGATFGRADTIKTQAPGGAYVIPADVVAHLGEGNNDAGARVLDEMMRSGPYGIPMPSHGRGGMGIPHPPPAPPTGAAKGGGVQGDKPGITPVLLSDGEYVVHPDQIVKKFGDLKRGHKFLDAFVVHQRKEHIAQLKKLPGPVKS